MEKFSDDSIKDVVPPISLQRCKCYCSCDRVCCKLLVARCTLQFASCMLNILSQLQYELYYQLELTGSGTKMQLEERSQVK